MEKYRFLIQVFLLLSFGMIYYPSCSQNAVEAEDLIGNWWFMDNTNHYLELYVSQDSLEFESNFPNLNGPFSYIVENDSLEYFTVKFRIKEMDCNTIQLADSIQEIELHKFSISIDKKRKANYYLRRSFVFVNLGILSFEEAIESLDSIGTLKDFPEK